MTVTEIEKEYFRNNKRGAEGRADRAFRELKVSVTGVELMDKMSIGYAAISERTTTSSFLEPCEVWEWVWIHLATMRSPLVFLSWRKYMVISMKRGGTQRLFWLCDK